MNRYLYLMTLLLTFGANASVSLKNNFCKVDPESKIYLEYLNTHKSSHFYQNIASQLGTELLNLTTTSEKEFYFCRASCKINQEIYHLWILNSDFTVNFSKMDGFTCKGVRIESHKISENLSVPTPVSENIFAFNSQIPELNKFLVNSQKTISTEEAQNELLQVKKHIQKLALGYQQSQHPVFIEAAQELISLTESLPVISIELKNKISELNKINWNNTGMTLNKDSVVNFSLMSHAIILRHLKVIP